MNRHAYMIAVHKHPEQIRILLQRNELHRPEPEVFHDSGFARKFDIQEDPRII